MGVCLLGHLSIVQLLLQHDNGFLKIANILGHHYNIVHFLLDQGANVHATTRDGKTAFAVACLAGHFGLVRRMIATGMEGESRDANQQTPLHHAASADFMGSIDVVRELVLQHNANEQLLQ